MGNIALKIAALIFGVLLWFLVISQRDFQLVVDAPLNFVKLSDNLAIASKPPQTIKITVEGKSWDLIRLRNEIQKGNSSVVAMVVDLQNKELGSTRIPLNSKNFNAPGFPNVRFLEPENHLLFIDIDLDVRISRSIPVHSSVSFNAAQGFLLADEPKITPEEIQVSGARNTVAKIIDIQTDSLSFDTLKAGKVYNVPLTFRDFPAFVSPSDSMVQIKVDIQKMASRTYGRIPVSLIGFYDRSQYAITPDTVSVEITGGINALDSITSKDIELFVEINRFAIEDVDSLQPTVKISLPPSVNRDMSIKATQIKPDKVYLKKFEVKKEEEAVPEEKTKKVAEEKSKKASDEKSKKASEEKSRKGADEKSKKASDEKTKKKAEEAKK